MVEKLAGLQHHQALLQCMKGGRRSHGLIRNFKDEKVANLGLSGMQLDSC